MCRFGCPIDSSTGASCSRPGRAHSGRRARDEAPAMTEVITLPFGANDAATGGPDSIPSGSIPPGLELVGARPLLAAAPVVWLPLDIGDRTLVQAGDAVAAGTPLAERS